jgi:hypothetical protein
MEQTLENKEPPHDGRKKEGLGTEFSHDQIHRAKQAVPVGTEATASSRLGLSAGALLIGYDVSDIDPPAA